MTIVAKIDLNKVDKSKLFAGKNGASYLDVVLLETPNNKFGDSHMVVQSVSKEERQAGIKGAILGGAKTLGFKPEPAKPAGNREQKFQSKPVADEDIPF